MSSEKVREELEAGVARELTPDRAVEAKVAEILHSLPAEAKAQAASRGYPLKRALVAGSAARGTFLPGQFDIDLFLLFDPSVSRKDLVDWGLAMGEVLLEAPEKKYAEHPYLRGTYHGMTTEVVPGYAVERSSAPITAVDRTPFHLEYLLSRHTEATRSDVRLLKKFLRGLGVYGAEVKTGGFSGYLTELLILRAGSFAAALREAATWGVPHRLSPPGKEPGHEESAALVLADPVDAHRNVAAALSRQNLAIFALACQAYLAGPRREYFFPPPRAGLDRRRAESLLGERGTTVAVVTFPVPDLVPDILYPQLRKSERSLAEWLERDGFLVIGSSSTAQGGQGIIAVETEEAKKGPVGIREGPAVGLGDADRFLTKWSQRPLLQGPYVTREGRLRVETAETSRDLADRVRESLKDLAAGKDLREVLSHQAEILSFHAALDSPAGREALGDLWRKRLPWLDWETPEISTSPPHAGESPG